MLIKLKLLIPSRNQVDTKPNQSILKTAVSDFAEFGSLKANARFVNCCNPRSKVNSKIWRMVAGKKTFEWIDRYGRRIVLKCRALTSELSRSSHLFMTRSHAEY